MLNEPTVHNDKQLSSASNSRGVHETTLKSAIYKGTIRHRRFTPKAHHFTYHVFMVYLDLSEIERVFSKSRWWSYKGFSLSWFRRKDFFDGVCETHFDSKNSTRLLAITVLTVMVR